MKYLELIKKQVDKNIKKKHRISSAIELAFQTLIESGELKERDILPIENDIIDYLKIGHMTIRKSLKNLESLGYIKRKKRVGVVITSNYLYLKKGIGYRIGLVFFSKKNIFKEGTYRSGFLERLCLNALASNIEIVPIQCASNSDCVDLVKKKSVDGLIIFSNKLNPYFHSLDSLKIPKFLFEDESDRYGYDNITIDPRDGYKEACSKLIKNGHSSFSFIIGLVQDGKKAESDSLFVPDNAVIRLKILKKCLLNLGLKYDAEKTYQVTYEQEDIDRLIKGLKNKNNFPSVFFTYNDQIGYMLKKSLQNEKLNIPRDIAIVGYGNYSIDPSSYSLSTITVNWDVISQKVINRFLERKHSNNMTDKKISISTSYLKRQSS